MVSDSDLLETLKECEIKNSVMGGLSAQELESCVDNAQQNLQQPDSALGFCIRGICLNLKGGEEYVPEAERLLTKAIKREPSLTAAWNSLGEVFWRKADVFQAEVGCTARRVVRRPR